MSLPHNIILGTAQLGMVYGINNLLGKPNKLKSFQILESAQEHGIDLLDTAEAYGDAIDTIGEFHKQNPTFGIISKFHIDSPVYDLQKNAQEKLTRLRIPSYYAYMYHHFADYYTIYSWSKHCIL